MKTKIILGIFLLASLALNFQQTQTSAYLLATNDKLIKDAQKSHPVHDAELTAWLGADKSLTIIVNGQFVHKYALTCFEGKQGRL